ncbi:adenylate/guanylate cyclase domain-containing protein [Gordonia hydrophobica]|uniref:Adenylate/guanylate cyclase domain-containing protein n=1 Tax=Gordonia hydrophobica TaxID=40516 RepID=A0ABZ2TZV1_9ACTN|nr:adenylate/guanylate cyclase domain-containing protein [Gordonia hydrophobica]MBM7369385.1 class 3 adenylate cyclase [Gordonia hydrophobica]
MNAEPRNDGPDADAVSGSGLHRASELLARTDESTAAVRVARLARRLAPAESRLTRAERTSDRVAKVLGDVRRDRPSAVREIGLASVAVWQSVIERRRPDPAGPVPATILFTDLVSFSSWALRAGDDQVLELLHAVNEASEQVIRAHGGQVVKTLGDGTMAVFVDAAEGIAAAHEAVGAVSSIVVNDFRPALRAGLHTGAPRIVGDDFLGVDVNIAARVCDAAGGGEVYVSDATLEQVDLEDYSIKRKRFKAKGVPRELQVFRVVPRYGERAQVSDAVRRR